MMYARVSQVAVQPQKVEEARRRYEESVVPALQEQAGFEGAMLLLQAESGRGISITIWESEEARIAGEVSGFYQEQLAKFSGLFTESPVRDAYEVAVHV